MIVDGLLECGEIEILPGSGFVLMTGIGPGVAVMKIDQQPHPAPRGSLGHDLRMLQIAERFFAGCSVPFWRAGIYEDTQADVIETMIF